jgi:hypothetical protein
LPHQNTKRQTFLKGTVLPDFEGFFMTYSIKSVLSAWALMVLKFFHLVVIFYFNILKRSLNVHHAKHCIICKMFTKAAFDLLPQVPFSRLCIRNSFPLAARDAQAGSL